MASKIVVGYDGSGQARDALALGGWLAEATGAGLVLANVCAGRPVGIGGGRADDYFDVLLRDAERVLSEAPGAEGLERRAVGASSPARGLDELAAELGAEAIVVGSAQRGRLGRVEAGHTAQHLLHGAPCPVAVAPAGYAAAPGSRHGRIAVGFDGSPEAGAALDAAIPLARALGARLRVIAVVEPVPTPSPLYAPTAELEEALRERADEWIAAAAAAVPDDVAVEEAKPSGDPADVLAEQPDCDLVVLGSRGYGRFTGVLLGSIATRVVRGALRPVLVVPRP